MRTPSPTAAMAAAIISIVVAVASGIAWLGQPLRLVHLLTIVGVSMTAGVAWAQAVRLARDARRDRADATRS